MDICCRDGIRLPGTEFKLLYLLPSMQDGISMEFSPFSVFFSLINLLLIFLISQCFYGDDSALIASGSISQSESDCDDACTGSPENICGRGSIIHTISGLEHLSMSGTILRDHQWGSTGSMYLASLFHPLQRRVLIARLFSCKPSTSQL